MTGSRKAAAWQDGQTAGQFELQQRALYRGVLHVGAGGKNFKRRRRVAEGGEQLFGFRPKVGFASWLGD
jgi:hypothetical protein